MRNKILYLVCIIAVTGAITLASGCFEKAASNSIQAATGKTTPGTVLKDLGTAPASAAVIANLKPFFTSCWILLIVGGLLAAVGGRSTGIMVVGVGVVSVMTGTLLAQFPWIALAVAVLALAAGSMEVIARWRSRRALDKANAEIDKRKAAETIIAEAVQTSKGGKDVKAKIKTMGVEAVKTVREIIDPIKEKLKCS